MKQCQYCAEDIQDEAIFCRYCKKDVNSSEQESTKKASEANDAPPEITLPTIQNSDEVAGKKPSFFGKNFAILASVILVVIFGAISFFNNNVTNSNSKSVSNCNLTTTYTDYVTLLNECGSETPEYFKAMIPYTKKQFCRYMQSVKDQDEITRSFYTVPGYADGLTVRVGDLTYPTYPTTNMHQYYLDLEVRDEKSIKWLDDFDAAIRGLNSAISDGPRSSVLSNLNKLNTLLNQFKDGKVIELSSLCK